MGSILSRVGASENPGAIQTIGADAVLLLTLTEARSDQSYVPKTTTTSGEVTQAGNKAKISATSQETGGYYVSKPVVSFKVEVFEAATNQTVWLATTETRGSSDANFRILMRSLADTTAEKLTAQRLLKVKVVPK
jgi:hypothetical protein